MQRAAKYSGHAGSGGLQAHSIGEIYPWTIRGLGDSCQAMHCITGELREAYRYDPNIEGSFAAAYAMATASINAMPLRLAA